MMRAVSGALIMSLYFTVSRNYPTRNLMSNISEITSEKQDKSTSAVIRAARKAPESIPGGVSRTMLNFIIDAMLLVAAVSMSWVTVMLMVVFPIPTRTEGWKLWGMDFNQWRQVHFALFVVVALLALEHLVLHWKWVCGVIVTKILKLKNRPDEGIQAVYGVGAFIGMLLFMGAGIVVAKLMVDIPPLP